MWCYHDIKKGKGKSMTRASHAAVMSNSENQDHSQISSSWACLKISSVTVVSQYKFKEVLKFRSDLSEALSKDTA